MLTECGFENDICGFEQDSGDHFDWTRNVDNTGSVNTGPDWARHGNFYMHIEASSPREQDDEAR